MEGKENQHLEPSQVKVEEPPGGSISWRDSVSERPPYSYMAMIQFAINSTKRKHMTLKDIYTWIEAHFPYFKHMAKPGWKNSIRRNLSLHDMFVQETSANVAVSPQKWKSPKPGYPMVGEPQVAILPTNHCLTEGLVLDTMNDSLSKILLDISFPGLEEDLLGPDNWVQLMPELW
ncbi:hypothetical protein QTO34_000443 [Cnephaeus nilssonii]|uniref:Forkhead box protein M1 n=1 Tax=Cnephaeus nilssonii TaxID=3371016 RepID=A0AA40IC11_CNENI|nr:hypothetical protein QTO34_000443 [Eptesicus nilssonii]